MAFRIAQRFQSMIECGLQKVAAVLARRTKHRSHSSVLGIIGDLARSKPQLSAEHVLLRQQLIRAQTLSQAAALHTHGARSLRLACE